jgi:hypothetical protein
MGKVAADLDGFFGLGDYHLLTDRVAVSRKFLDSKVSEPLRYNAKGEAFIPAETTLGRVARLGTKKKVTGTPGDIVKVEIKDADGVVTGVKTFSDPTKERGMLETLANDVELQLGKLQPESIGPRKIKDDYFIGGRQGDDTTRIGTGIDIGDGEMIVEGVPVNYNRLFQVDRTKDPYLDNIIQLIQRDEPITYAQDVYLRQRVLEKMGKARAETTTKVVGAGDELITVKDTDSFRPVVEGSEFQKQVMVPDERRLGTARTTKEAYQAFTPRVIRDGLKTFKENVMNPVKTLDDLGNPIDARVARLQEAQTEALVSLQRQTPIVARKLYKDSDAVTVLDDAGESRKLTNAERNEYVVDTMMTEALEGQDYTRLIKDGITPSGTPGKWNSAPTQIFDEAGNVNETVYAFYETLLGPSFVLKENQIAFQQAVVNLGIAPSDMFTNQSIAAIAGEMQRLNKNALATAAVEGRTFVPNVRIPFTDVNIQTTKYTDMIPGE